MIRHSSQLLNDRRCLLPTVAHLGATSAKRPVLPFKGSRREPEKQPFILDRSVRIITMRSGGSRSSVAGRRKFDGVLFNVVEQVILAVSNCTTIRTSYSNVSRRLSLPPFALKPSGADAEDLGRVACVQQTRECPGVGHAFPRSKGLEC